MPSFKNPSFQERMSLAQQARQKALNQLRAKPPVDEAVLAERAAKLAARELAQAEARAAKLAAREQAKADKQARALEAAQAADAAVGATEAERKAARDARYAARKKRKGGR
jgi:hypothetical protein